MKSNLNYWKFDAEAEALAMQAICHEEHKLDQDNVKYFATTTAFARATNPIGERFWVIRAPSGVVRKQSLINKMKARNNNIRIVKSKKSWFKTFVEDGE